MAKAFDVGCYDLASLFLSDFPHIENEANRVALAGQIQDVIEDFLREKLEEAK